MRVMIVNSGLQYEEMFTKEGWELVWNLFDYPDLIQFTGGSDVTPEIYGQENAGSYNDLGRDLKEAGIFALALRMRVPMAGICRGGQFLNVMCGGSMIQNVPNHCGPHWAYPPNTKDGVDVSSTHHQMMVPGEHGVVELCASEFTKHDVEAVSYEKQQVLCFQPHPEFDKFPECRKLYFKLLKSCLGLGR